MGLGKIILLIVGIIFLFLGIALMFGGGGALWANTALKDDEGYLATDTIEIDQDSYAVISEPDCGHYTASKGGIEAFCRTLASELAPHKITANFVRPGATLTELTVPLYTPSIKRALFERVPLKEIAEASWIAAGVVFLASDESRYMTGQHLTIDGGYEMDGSLPYSAEYGEE